MDRLGITERFISEYGDAVLYVSEVLAEMAEKKDKEAVDMFIKIFCRMCAAVGGRIGMKVGAEYVRDLKEMGAEPKGNA